MTAENGRLHWTGVLLAWASLAALISAQLLFLAASLPWIGLGLSLLSAGLLLVGVAIRFDDQSLKRERNSRERAAAGMFLIAYLIVSASYMSGWHLFGTLDGYVWATLNVIAFVLVFRGALIPTKA